MLIVAVVLILLFWGKLVFGVCVFCHALLVLVLVFLLAIELVTELLPVIGSWVYAFIAILACLCSYGCFDRCHHQDIHTCTLHTHSKYVGSDHLRQNP